jgi:catechol 2,3-dioxygenase-like lactoylglutathione lyase family enzyme
MNANSAKPIVVTLWAPDPEALAPFYAHTLRLPRDDHHGHAANFQVDDTHLVIMPGEPQPPRNQKRDPWPIFAFSTPHYDAIKETLSTQGVPVLDQSPAGQVHEWIMFPDPAGNILELVRG